MFTAIEEKSQTPEMRPRDNQVVKPEILDWSPDNLKAVRKARRLSRQDVADRAVISMDSVKKYETGKLKPTADMLIRIGAVLNVEWRLVQQARPRKD